MARLMSVSLTEDAVAARRKRVTRRAGWTMLHVGDHLVLCRKVMGRRKGEPLVRLAEVVVTDIRREQLNVITADDVALEGFPDWTPEQFVEFFCLHMGGRPDQEITRIEWEYRD